MDNYVNNLNFTQFAATSWAKHNTTVAMEQNHENYDFGLKDANVKITKKNTNNVIKCNQCDFASSQTDHLRTHLKTHSGKK